MKSTSKKSKWSLHTRGGGPFDIHRYPFVEAICEHGVGHHKGVHGCDGCCSNVPEEIWEAVTDDKMDKT